MAVTVALTGIALVVLAVAGYAVYSRLAGEDDTTYSGGGSPDESTTDTGDGDGVVAGDTIPNDTDGSVGTGTRPEGIGAGTKPKPVADDDKDTVPTDTGGTGTKVDRNNAHAGSIASETDTGADGHSTDGVGNGLSGGAGTADSSGRAGTDGHSTGGGNGRSTCPECGTDAGHPPTLCPSCGSAIAPDHDVVLEVNGRTVGVEYGTSVGGRIRRRLVESGVDSHPARQVSGAHLEFDRRRGSLVVRDTNSTHGTTMDGKPLPEETWVECRDGARLRLADAFDVTVNVPPK
jgi:hypothetical protein